MKYESAKSSEKLFIFHDTRDGPGAYVVCKNDQITLSIFAIQFFVLVGHISMFYETK